MHTPPPPPAPPPNRLIRNGRQINCDTEHACTDHHHHVTKDGTLVKCYHACKSVLVSPAFWIGSTLSFPIEHALWTKLPFLSAIAKWAGL